MSGLSKATVASMIAEAVAAALAAERAPIAPAPVKTSAAFGNKTFDAYVADRRAAAIPCEIHEAAACNRAFSPKSSGRQGHVARIV